jgi:6,7-dimethyl-8-ribityllumazine synthase
VSESFPEQWPERSSESVTKPRRDSAPPKVAPGDAKAAAAAPVPAEPAPAAPSAPEPADEAAAPTGDIEIPDDVDVLEGEAGPTRRHVAVVVARASSEFTTKLLESALGELDRIGVARAQVTVVPVPGAFELPLAAMALAKTRRYLCVVALGCVIRGETPQFEYVASEAASGLQLAGLETGIPVSYGVLTCDTEEQARARTGKGAEAVRTALEMADLFGQLRKNAASG